MKYLYISIAIFIGAIVLSGCSGKEIDDDKAVFDTMTKEKSGVEFSIDQIGFDEDNTIIDVSLSNHRFNLKEMELNNYSEMAGIKPIAFEIMSEAMGGHHLKGKLIFNSTTIGDLKIGLKNGVSVYFNKI